MTVPTTQRQRAPVSWRQRLEIVPGRHRPKRIRTGIIFVSVTMIFLWIIYTKPSLPFLSGGGHALSAEFAYAANVHPGYTPVRLHGVNVGEVTDVTRAPSGRGVLIKMNIADGKGVQLHTDASLSLRWRTLLGRNMYIDIDPGSTSAPALRGGFVPRTRTSSQVELDTALEPLNAQGRDALQTMIRQFDASFSDAKAIQSTLSAVAPAMRPLGGAMEALRGTEAPTDLPRVIAGTSRAAAGLARDEAALGGLIDSGRVALGVTAARSADLAATLNTAPAAMHQARTTMTRLVSTLDVLDPLANKLTPGVAKLDGAAQRAQTALNAATPMLADLRPTLQDLRPAVAKLDTAARAGAPAFGPLSSTMDRVKTTFIPWLNAKNDENKRPNYQNVGPAVASVSSATSWGDYNGPVANFEAAVGPNAFVDSPCKISLANVRSLQLIQCELVSRALTAALTGQKPQNVKVRNSAVPQNVLQPFLSGLKTLVPDPHLKPLRLGRTK
jgi:phospholipid/cholesterol/gamma-HCH transport system substrate-binding protein